MLEGVPVTWLKPGENEKNSYGFQILQGNPNGNQA
jgi:hypothetical protein